ncbi:hypothetical protein ABE288_20575 [Bacillus salipaludis]|uniref:hypothetical protein n=1 Tax=Bacillus salipaludis TaxID=2547811 RepID=UPI003D2368B3
MKYVDYFYMGVAERDMEKDINHLLEKIESTLMECRIEITSLGINSMKTHDLKMLNAYVKSKAEESKATQIYTTMIGFGVGFLTLLLKDLITKYPTFGLSFFFLLFIVFFCAFKYEEKKYRKKVQQLYYLSSLLDLYISRKAKIE